MTETKVQAIKRLLECLPNRDVALARAFLINRDIEKLYYLVKSDVEKYEMDAAKPVEERKLNDIDADTLGELWVLVSEYWDGICPIEQEDDEYV